MFAVLAAVSIAAPLSIPPKWHALFAAPTPEQKHCAEWSALEWDVRAVGGVVEISPRKERRGDPLPFDLEGPLPDSQRGDRTVVPVADGWIVGFDGGEFGGGLWWFSKSSDDSRQISAKEPHQFEENVRGILRRGHNLFVLQGLAHLSINNGAVVRVRSSPPHDAHILAVLPGAPFAFAEDPTSPDAILVDASGGFDSDDEVLVRVDAAGKVSTIAKVPRLGARSIAVDRDKRIWLGMRHFVVVVSPQEDGRMTSLVPQDCTTFTFHDYHCICGDAGQAQKRE